MTFVHLMHMNRHFRAGAPPVINPIQTAFPNDTSVSLAHNLTLTVPSGQSVSVTLFNVTHPKPGDWFLAAHLPKDDGKIEQQVCFLKNYIAWRKNYNLINYEVFIVFIL